LIPVFYINLASAPQRRKSIEDQLAALGLAGTRIEATTPADISPTELTRYCTPRSLHWIQPVELACNRSHMDAWSRLQASGAKAALVLEDDVILSSQLPKFLRALDAQREVPDLIQLQTALTPVRMEQHPLISLDDISLIRTYGFVGGSSAYVISAPMAKRLGDKPLLFRNAIDRVLFDSLGLGRRIGFAHSSPALAVQAHVIASQREIEVSAIAPHYQARTSLLPPSAPQRLARRAAELWTENIVVGGQKVWLDLTGRRKRVVPFAP
jgi:GR25 family glycosyltransferase involved in LPS biosynthesis